jgi:glutamyl-tRNA reductase
VDIAVPRDIDPAVAELANVFLYDIDDLEAVVRENTKHRAQELTFCSAIIAEYAAELMVKLDSRFVAKPKHTFNEGLGAELVPGFSLETSGVR